jgi:hypothetical protein
MSLLAVFSLATLVDGHLFSILCCFIHSEVELELLMLNRGPPISLFWPQQVLHVSCRDWCHGIKLPEEVVKGLSLHTGRVLVIVADDLVHQNVLDLSVNNFTVLEREMMLFIGT